MVSSLSCDGTFYFVAEQDVTSPLGLHGQGLNISVKCCVLVFVYKICRHFKSNLDSIHLCVCVPDLQVQVHPVRLGHMFALGDTVFLGCQASGCAASGRSLALYRCVKTFDQEVSFCHCRSTIYRYSKDVHRTNYCVCVCVCLSVSVCVHVCHMSPEASPSFIQ